MENLYPIFLNLREKRCVVVGGGAVASHKVEKLLSCGAHITVISPNLTSALESAAARGELEHIRDEYESHYLGKAFMVFVACGDEATNLRIAADCAARDIMINVVDVPELCGFFVPAVVSRGPLSIAVSTAGASPAFARFLREELESCYGEDYGKFVAFLGELRPKIRTAIADPVKRRELYLELARTNFFELFQSLSPEALEREVASMIVRYGGEDKRIQEAHR